MKGIIESDDFACALLECSTLNQKEKSFIGAPKSLTIIRFLNKEVIITPLYHNNRTTKRSYATL